MVGLNAVVRRLRPIFVMLLLWDASEVLRAADAESSSVTELTLEQATELASTQGDLELSHLRTLSPQVADLLARSKHAIILNGLTSLSPESAAALAKHSQLLRMDGLETVSEEVAAALAHHDGAVYLLGIETLSDRAAGLLEANPRIHLPVRFRPPAPPEFPAAFPNSWLRVTRRGNQFSAFASTDGKSWKRYGEQVLPLANTVKVGPALTSHNPSVAAQAAFRDYTEAK